MKEFIGSRIGRLTLQTPCVVGNRPGWRCLCDCGNVVETRRTSLRYGFTRSCGCIRREKARRRARQRNRLYFGAGNPQFTHGESVGGKVTPEYASFQSAKSRCTNPNNHKYARYGGRGIEFRFSTFEQFLAEVGRRPAPGYTIDRINNDGHYEPGNIRWATYAQQARNKTYGRRIRTAA